MVASKGGRNWEKTQAPLLRAALEKLGTGDCHAWQNEDASAKGRLTERPCVETLAPIFPPNYRTVCSESSPEQTKKNKSRNKIQSNTQKWRALCQRNKTNSLKIIKASDVNIGTLQRFWHVGDSGRTAGPTCCPQSRACPARYTVPHLLFHLLILTHKQTTKGFLTLKDSLKHERDIQTTRQYSPQENKEFGSRGWYTNQTEIPDSIPSIKKERGPVAMGQSENKDKLLELITAKITIPYRGEVLKMKVIVSK